MSITAVADATFGREGTEAEGPVVAGNGTTRGGPCPAIAATTDGLPA